MARPITGAHDGPLLALCFDTPGDTLFSSGMDGRVIAWSMRTDERRVLAELGDDPALALVWWNGALWALAGGALVTLTGTRHELPLEDAHLLFPDADAGGDRLVAVGNGVAVSVTPAATIDERWTLPAGETTDATIDAKRLLVVKTNVVHAIHRKTGATKAWRKKSGWERTFVRLDGSGRAWAVAHGTYTIDHYFPESGAIRKNAGYHSGDSAAAGPCEIDATRRYLALLHVGRDLQIWDLAQHTRFFQATIDPDVSNDEALEGLSRVPRFKEFAPGMLKRVSSIPRPPYPDGARCLAIAPDARRAAIGHAAGGIVLVDIATAAITTLGETRTTLHPPLCERMWALGRIAAATRARNSALVHAIAEDGRLVTLDAAKGERVADLALEGFACEHVYEVTRVPEGVRAWTNAGLFWWSMDGRLLRRLTEPGHWHVLFDRHGYNLEWAKPAATLQQVDLATGETVSWPFTAPEGVELDYVQNWAQLYRVGDRCAALFRLRGSVETVRFYDLATRELGASLPYDPMRAIVDATGRVIAGPGNKGWLTHEIASGAPLESCEKPAGLGGHLSLLDVDLESGRVAGHDGRNSRVCIWEKDGSLVAQLPGMSNPILGALTERGTRLLTIEQSGVARFWRCASRTGTVQ